MLILNLIFFLYWSVDLSDSKVFNVIGMYCTNESNYYVDVDQCQIYPKSNGVLIANFRAIVKSRVSPDLIEIYVNKQADGGEYKSYYNISFDFCSAVQGKTSAGAIPMMLIMKVMQVKFFNT